MAWLISKWIALLVLAGGILLALWIAWRLRRGQSVALGRNVSPRLVRTAAIILVGLGIGASADDAQSQPRDRAPSQRDLIHGAVNTPQDLTAKTIARWRRFDSMVGQRDFLLQTKRILSSPELYDAMPKKEREDLSANLPAYTGELGKLILEDIQLTQEGMSPAIASPERLLRILNQMEEQGHYDHWFNAYLWRKTRAISAKDEAGDLATLFALIQQHARITDALIQASFEVKPTRFSPRAWMSKGGPPRDLMVAEDQSIKKMTDVAQQVLAGERTTTWRRDAVLRLKLDEKSGPAVLNRDGKAIKIRPGETFAFGRLDLIQPAGEEALEIRDLDFGLLHVPAGTVVSVWSLPDCLEITGFKSLQSTAEAAAAGDERAARRLELALPLAHKSIREALRDGPHGAGAPRLRTILALFDDTPTFPPKANKEQAEQNGREFPRRQ